MNSSKNEIKKLYTEYFGNSPDEIIELPPSGSNRYYYRLIDSKNSAIATYNADRHENEAFLYITNKLMEAGVSVPKIYGIDLDNDIYLQEDLGDENLFDKVEALKNNEEHILVDLYKTVIRKMPAIQYRSAIDFDFSICFPRKAFDRQSIQWDLNYFKHYFLKLAYIPFHEQKLEDDFQHLADFLLEVPADFFLFRDFQSRNIMFKNNKPYFIDYQGGRRGALQYDLASLLYEGKTGLSQSIRDELLEYYIEVFSEYPFFDRDRFLIHFPAFALIRQLQAFGAYGYRGYFERKSFFLKSIPFGLKNLRTILDQLEGKIHLPHLFQVLERMIEGFEHKIPELTVGRLTLSVNSFSFKRSYPNDYTGNGGGYVFDCRGLPNPGRYNEYKSLTGRDKEVIEFLEQKAGVNKFLKNCEAVTAISIENYLSRGFEHLMISFGCTGGQHRSVYCAEKYAKWAHKSFDLDVALRHYELPVESKHDQVNV